MLIIMDGWGIGKVPHADAIKQAYTPFVDSLYNKYPNSTLVTCGTEVGLPAGQMGNSEVGHLNLGAGRVVYQELERINVAVRTKMLDSNPQLLAAIKHAKDNQVALHLMGLVSDGGVHSHIEHLKALCDICKDHQVERLYIHAFTDGRDTDPKGGAKYLKDLQQYLNNSKGTIASIIGRYYAMDRDKRWERVAIAYNALVHGKGHLTHNPLAAVDDSYEAGITDEFIMPIITTDASNQPVGIIQPNDAVLCFNFRTDRCREITIVLTQQDVPEQNMNKLPLHYTTMTEYDKTYTNVNVLFNNDDLKNTLGEVISQQGKTQLRIAETEKYPHVTFFFSGGRENNFKGEDRIVVPSPKDVATYDLKPEMSANELTTEVVNAIDKSAPNFICLNYANADMVGHTGVWKAAIKAAETVDACVQKVVVTALQKDYTILLTADHGNSDLLINDDGSPNTAHTLNPVPLFLISNHPNKYELLSGKLGDIAPTILTIMELPIPVEMTGDVLVRNA
jgi:2,3-bisphosphoglycerate-independent phosphoglycerate mutase